jgi:hypothetical protein
MKTAMGVVAVALLGGCLGAAGFQTTLQSRRGELMYLREMTATERQGGTVSIGQISVEHALPPQTTVKKTGGWVVPLLFVNLWKGTYLSDLGAAQLTNDHARFIKESLTEDLRRGLRYALVDQGGDLQVDVTVTNIQMRAPIVESGQFLFLLIAASWGRHVWAGPVEVAVQGEVVARRAGQEVVRKPVAGNARSGSLVSGKDAKIEDYTSAMIECMSLAVKSFNGAVVEEVNRL